MDIGRKELLVSRIISGSFRFKFQDRIYLIKNPSREVRYVSQEVYTEALIDAKREGLFDEDSLLLYLLQEGLWTEEEDKMLNNMEKDTEKLKVRIYEAVFRREERELARSLLRTVEQKQNELQKKKTSHNHLTCEWSALHSKTRYLIAHSIEPNPIKTYWDDSSAVLDYAVSNYFLNKIQETEYREIARTDPWRTLWSLHDKEPIFGTPIVDFTEEQKNLCAWSRLYDSVYQSQDRPPNEIVEDNDALDGWLILQKRKHESDLNKQNVEGLVKNERIKNADEVYIVADNLDDAQKITDMNEGLSKQMVQARNRLIRKKGEVNQAELPDIRLKLLRGRNG